MGWFQCLVAELGLNFMGFLAEKTHSSPCFCYCYYCGVVWILCHVLVVIC